MRNSAHYSLEALKNKKFRKSRKQLYFLAETV